MMQSLSDFPSIGGRTCARGSSTNSRGLSGGFALTLSTRWGVSYVMIVIMIVTIDTHTQRQFIADTHEQTLTKNATVEFCTMLCKLLPARGNRYKSPKHLHRLRSRHSDSPTSALPIPPKYRKTPKYNLTNIFFRRLRFVIF